MSHFPRIAAVLLLLVAIRPLAAEPLIPAADRYAEAVRQLEPFIAREVADKGIPALSIALIDDQHIVWARGFGASDPAAGKKASADTVYRVGSVSKLFTDIAIMQLVEQGKLDLDAPVMRYLPDFKPDNPFDKPITLRQMMAHRSGLVREPPVGNYFDPDEPSLETMVKSLNKTRLVYEPGKKTKYSNAAIATVGYVLQKTQKEPFARYLERKVLEPLDMRHSSFAPRPELTRELAKAVMWSYPGREFPAPTFELGMAPAGSMFSTVLDLGKFLEVLFARGKGPHGQILKSETLDEMWTPQFIGKGEKEGFGLGFLISPFEGTRRIGHGGAVYGFATELEALPQKKLGVVVIASRDVVNAVCTRIAETALRHMLAVREGKPLPKIEGTTPLSVEEARRLAGHYECGKKAFDLYQRDGHLWLIPVRGGMRVELRRQGDRLVVDDRLLYGESFERTEDGLRLGKDSYQRVEVKPPPPCPERWRGLIGEYGWDHNTLYILEKDGRLQALIEWIFLYPLTEESENVYAFPDFGLYHGEKLRFRRDGKGRATEVEAASVVFKRRRIDGEDGSTFHIQPQRPLEELRRLAREAKPPREPAKPRSADLIELTRLEPGIKLDIRYATTNNFLSTPFYRSARAFLQRPAAEALVRIHKKLGKQGYGLLVYDGYRPWSVTKMFWDATPPKFRLFVANPEEGSRHNRGCAVDLTLYDLESGKPVEMVGGFDEFSDRSYPDYLGGTSRQRYHRDLLRRAMEDEGFTVYFAEWWHFDYKTWRDYPILNKPFEEIAESR
jgi:serine beta-lactamase-like protein LACTB